MANLTVTLKHWDAAATADLPHVLITLLGQFKGESGKPYQWLPHDAVTNSQAVDWMSSG